MSWHSLNGTVGYAGGTAGTVTVPEGAVLICIIAHSTSGGSLTIFGGASIPIVAAANPTTFQFFHTLHQANSLGQTVVLTSTDMYFVEWVLQR
jgi:hypothetical protein